MIAVIGLVQTTIARIGTGRVDELASRPQVDPGNLCSQASQTVAVLGSSVTTRIPLLFAVPHESPAARLDFRHSGLLNVPVAVPVLCDFAFATETLRGSTLDDVDALILGHVDEGDTLDSECDY